MIVSAIGWHRSGLHPGVCASGAAGNTEIARVHRNVTERIRIIRRLDFTLASRPDATYEEYGKIPCAVQRKRGTDAVMLLRAHILASQAEVRKITLHPVHLARSGQLAPKAP